MVARPFAFLAVLALVLAGCASQASDDSATGGVGGGAPSLTVDSQTGGIRGVVVDAAITPIMNAAVALSGTTLTTKTDRAGIFTFSGLKPGDYFFTVSKPGYTTVQSSTTVQAGVAEPPVVKVEIAMVPGKQPYVESWKLNGFYECAFSFGIPDVTPVITDQCDFVVRTAYDEANGTVPYPAPRNVMAGQNTQYFDVAADTLTIVQEAFWKDETVPNMMVTLSSTPISNDCDCSKTDYMESYQANPSYNRIDADKDAKKMPLGLRVAARGFLDWNSPSSAQNFQFTVITTLFHNYKAAEGWTFETQEKYPIGE
ncbi:MAG TPA: carboxypeptidase-like regulatory domain-containing protein [Candidatus Thermoplasmatota archaeon]|nr:carboxypeptidase-like regulatory domain-containing protein [Candidatus Thermoplasmatota archaeon]